MNRRQVSVALVALVPFSVACGILGLSSPNTSPTRATHSWFPIGPSSTHASTDCNSCHGEFDTFKKFDCLTSGCHAQADTTAKHANVSGFVYDSPHCYLCHPDGTAIGVDHTKVFPIAMGDKHQNIACTSCHTDPSNRKNVSCAVAGCHDQGTIDPQHSAVGGYQYQSPLCLKCHADSQINPVAGHLPFQIQANTKHYRQSCLTCHPSTRSDKPFGEDFGPFDCISACHRDAHNQSFGSVGCVASGCHQDGAKHGG